MFGTEKQKTGYPSIDKPWLKFYDKALNESDIPECSAYHLLYQITRIIWMMLHSSTLTKKLNSKNCLRISEKRLCL